MIRPLKEATKIADERGWKRGCVDGGMVGWLFRVF